MLLKKFSNLESRANKVQMAFERAFQELGFSVYKERDSFAGNDDNPEMEIRFRMNVGPVNVFYQIRVDPGVKQYIKAETISVKGESRLPEDRLYRNIVYDVEPIADNVIATAVKLATRLYLRWLAQTLSRHYQSDIIVVRKR